MEKEKEKTPIDKEELFKKIMSWSGAVFILMSIIVYMIVVYIYIKGFEVNISSSDAIIFASISAVFSVLVLMGAGELGISLAKNTDTAKEVEKEYIKVLPQSKKPKNKPRKIGDFQAILLFKDIFIKATSIGGSVFLVVSFAVKGVEDPQYMLMALGNIFIALSMGATRILRTYEAYMTRHIPWMQIEINDIMNELKENKNDLNERQGDVDGNLKRSKESSERDVREVRGHNTDQGTIEDNGELEQGGTGTDRIDEQPQTIESGLCRSSEDISSET